MKKIFSLLLALSLLLACSVSVAETGIQLIPDPEDADYISLDDVKLNVPAQAEDLFTFTATSFEYVNALEFYKAGRTEGYSGDTSTFNSGADEEYALLRADILNEQMSEIDFTKDIIVIAVYDERYKYTGAIHQYNYNNHAGTDRTISAADNFAIRPLYEGHYAFLCPLPNFVVNSKKPLKIVITIGEVEITYNIRK